MSKKISYEYIRGLVESKGSFAFTSNNRKSAAGNIINVRIPTFSIGIHERDQDLLCSIRDTMGLENKVYNYKSSNKDGYNRGGRVLLIVREIGNLKNVIVPFFYNKLAGYRRTQFDKWLEDIGKDPRVPESYKIIYRLHKNNFYKNNQKFVDDVCQQTS